MAEIIGDCAIILKGVYKKYDNGSAGGSPNDKKHYALKNINLKIRRGEVVGIIGVNGSGKTTLLKIIAGILKPTKGRVKVKGEILPLLQLGAGFNPELTGRENIKMNSVLLGVPEDKISERTEQVIEFSGLEDAINEKVKTYSTGMIMRLAFSTFLLSEFSILLIDEAISVGDEIFQKKSLGLIRSMKERGKTILLVSHSMPWIIDMCDKTVYLEKGEIKTYGSPEKVVYEYLNRVYTKNKSDFLKKLKKKKTKLDELKKKEEQIKNSLEKNRGRILNSIIVWKQKKNLAEVNNEIESLSQWILENGETEKAILNSNLRKVEQQLKELTRNRKNEKEEKSRTEQIIEQKKKMLKELDNVLSIQLKTDPFPNKKEEILRSLREVLLDEIFLLKDTKNEVNLLRRAKELLENEFNYKDERIDGELNYINARLFFLDSMEDVKSKKLLSNNDLKRTKMFSNLSPVDSIKNTAELLRSNVIKIDEKLVELKQQLEQNSDADTAELVRHNIESLERKREQIVESIGKLKEKAGIKKRGSHTRIVRVKLMGKNAENEQLIEKDVFFTGKPLIIEIEYFAEKEVLNPVFGIAIYRDDGTHITGPNTKFHDFPIKSICGKGHVRYKIKELPLLQGKYFVTAAIHTEKDFLPLDISDRLTHFEVKSKIKDYGIVYINSEWEHNKS